MPLGAAKEVCDHGIEISQIKVFDHNNVQQAIIECRARDRQLPCTAKNAGGLDMPAATPAIVVLTRAAVAPN